ncbi:MAG TPA: endopeptidase La, partial [Bacteroidales bacterium]|nr:endopeptidase La [Bacteroidales bacterium]
MNNIDEAMGLFPLMEDQPNHKDKLAELTDTLPLLALKNIVMFPGVIKPIGIGRPKSLELIREAYAKGMLIGAITQKSVYIEDPTEKDLYKIGTICKVLKVIDMPDNTTTALIQGIDRFKLKDITSVTPYFKGTISKLFEKRVPKKDTVFDATILSIKDTSIKIIEISKQVPEEIIIGIKNFKNNRFLINFIASNLDLDISAQQNLLEISDLKKRAAKLLDILGQQIQLAEIKHDIQKKVKMDIDKQQREFLMQQQIKTLQKELGNSPIDKEFSELKAK